MDQTIYQLKPVHLIIYIGLHCFKCSEWLFWIGQIQIIYNAAEYTSLL